ncbi:bifunctional acetate--CoA ligase family protein/GNAT family N-acetyltransferase [Ramlibacter tataouinensis]|uniref:bifunctional acetate--CoA ligase family protein/GNAT family N-acetyltransferase n=1 Tax=Ramlibacter tataouinensis TaxID=94132 RepID=UPI0022F3EA7A|nr:bifunctional acetate--CoA ligase family protein/GNAT family N-acetyltransferase [Ramlibacter tataouinensis]WBY02576.1 bifunctional acetate--CoA ligase family protein/GNAT family N-acetyltransferase [Ramlibacter tataouinensis]
MSVRNLEYLFRPASVALVGASDRPGSVGQVVFRNLREGGFAGPIWPVNRRHRQVGGEQAWPDVASLPGRPDLAVICTPAPTVPELIDQLGRKGARAAVVLSAGLKNRAAPDAPSYEQQMLDAARPWLLRILGPNCIGLLLPGLGLNASFAPAPGLTGPLAFVTQSGALATAMLDWARGRGIGFSHFISMGDSADVDFGDVLDYLGSEANTRAILMYAESVKAARKFMSAARAAARNKPVIVVKSGRAPEGARAAASHTGALAGSDLVFDAAVRRAGMLRVDTLEDLFDAAETLARARRVAGERIAILTNGGGAGVLAADALSLQGGTLAELSAATLAALDAVLPATWSRGNPVDIIGDAPAQRYVDALGALLQAPEVDAVLFVHAPTALVPAPEIAQACVPVLQGSRKPVLTCWLGGPAVAAARTLSAQAGLPSYATPERAVAAWLQMVTHARNQRALQEIAPAESPNFEADRAAALALLETAAREGREWLDEVEAKRLLAAYRIPVVRTELAADADEAAAIADAIGYPVALKIVSPQIVHKSDIGGVALNLGSADAVRQAVQAMTERVAQARPDAAVKGFAVQQMVRRPGAREVIVGLSTDPVFGPVLLCGVGGTEVELHRRHALALPPLNRTLAADLLGRSGLPPLLRAWRSRPAADQEAVLDALVQVSQLACDLSGVAELDINPLLVDADGAVALDARVRLRAPGAVAPPLAIRPYPQELEETFEIAGRRLSVRPIRPDDGARLHAFYDAATPGDLRLRFFMMRREVPHSELARFSQIDYDREMTFVALPLDGGDTMAGEVRAIADPDNEVAEFAIQVAREWQGRGLGRALLDKLLRYLRGRGTQEVVGTCLPENAAMASLALRMGFEVIPGEDHTQLRLRLG